MKTLVLCLALALTVAAVPSYAAEATNVAGAWNIDGSVQGNAVKYVCTLAQEGDKLTGTAKIEDKDIPVTGSVKEKEVTWQFDIVYQGTPLTLVFTATLDTATDMKGTIAVAGLVGDFTAKKV